MQSDPKPLITLATLHGPSRTESVVQQLREAIQGGRLEAGQQLPTEAALGAQLGVSRTVIREAVSQLKAEGIVTTHQGKGVFVADRATASALRFSNTVPEKDSLQHWFELRAVVEVGAAARAASARTSADVTAIRAALLAIDRDIERGDSGGNSDVAFHFAIAQATHNPYFIDLLDFLQARLSQTIRTAWDNSREAGHGPYPAQVEHTRIYDAIKNRDVQAATRATRTHLLNAATRLGLKAVV